MPLGLRSWFAGRVAGPVVELDWWQSVQHKGSSSGGNSSSTGGQSGCVDMVCARGCGRHARGTYERGMCDDAAAAFNDTCIPDNLLEGAALKAPNSAAHVVPVPSHYQAWVSRYLEFIHLVGRLSLEISNQ